MVANGDPIIYVDRLTPFYIDRPVEIPVPVPVPVLTATRKNV